MLRLFQVVSFIFYSNLRELEAELRPSASYMAGHGSAHQPALFIDEGMRRIAVSWLVEVSCESSLHQETLVLATSLLDRFLSITTVSGLSVAPTPVP